MMLGGEKVSEELHRVQETHDGSFFVVVLLQRRAQQNGKGGEEVGDFSIAFLQFFVLCIPFTFANESKFNA